MQSSRLERRIKQKGYKNIAGLDEAGRGPWAGPVVAAAVILPKKRKFPGLKNSKLLSGQKREEFFDLLQKKAICGWGIVSAKKIDEKGLIYATELAFKKAIKKLSNKPDFLLVDGRDKFKFKAPFESIVRGDEKIRSIAAASIVAKVVRDRIMLAEAKKYEKYGFERHKGYGTREHQKALRKHGICPIHRKSYEPVKLVDQNEKS